MRDKKLTFKFNLKFGLFSEMDIFVNGLRVSSKFESDVKSVQEIMRPSSLLFRGQWSEGKTYSQGEVEIKSQELFKGLAMFVLWSIMKNLSTIWEP